MSIDLYALLVSLLTKGRPVICRAARNRDGFEVWRLMSAEFTTRGKSKTYEWLKTLYTPTFPTKESDFGLALLEWEAECSQYELETGKTLDKDMLLACLRHITPKAFQPDLAMHSDRFDNYSVLRTYIEEYLANKDMWKRSAGNAFGAARKDYGGDAMDIGALGDKGKGKKGKKGKGKGDNNKDKKCDKCGKLGHIKADCWQGLGAKGAKGDKNQKGAKGDKKDPEGKGKGDCSVCNKKGHKA